MINKIQKDLVQAMRDKDTRRLNVLRGLKSALTNASLQKGSISESLTETEITQLIRKQVAQREDSIKQFRESNRDDVVARILIEHEESEILKQYLPEELSDLQLEIYVVNTITELGATSKKDMGNVIKRVVHIVNGRADNRRISKLVGEKLQ